MEIILEEDRQERKLNFILTVMCTFILVVIVCSSSSQKVYGSFVWLSVKKFIIGYLIFLLTGIFTKNVAVKLVCYTLIMCLLGFGFGYISLP